MICGIGCDIVKIIRMERSSNLFANRILSATELQDYHHIKDSSQALQFLASRFAAKEACAKAMGVGIGQHLSWKDMSITNDPYGRPDLACSKFSSRQRCFLSIAHEREYAIAYCILMEG